MAYNYTQVEFWMIVIGGLGLFLYGIALISKVLKRIAGDKLRKIINKCSSNRFSAMLTGALFTAGIQSSGATSALAIGLVRAGLMTLVQALAIIIGANIGTTITSFIISIPVMEYMPVILLIGTFIVMICTRQKHINIGELCFSVGLIFFGLWVLQMNLKSLAGETFFVDFFSFLTNYPWLGLLIGAVITALLQSSSAVVGVVQGIYAASILAFGKDNPNVVSLLGILPIIFGSNIGSTSTALLASIGGTRDSKRVALFHLLFNVAGSLLCMGIMYLIKDWLKTSPSWGISPQLQIAFSHLIFNVITALIFIPLINPVAKLLKKIVRGEDKHNAILTIEELDKGLLKEFPSQGIDIAKNETQKMFGYTKIMMETINAYLDTHLVDDGNYVHDLEIQIDSIDRNLNEYLLDANKGLLSGIDLKKFTSVLRGSKDIERIGDYAENIVVFYETAHDKNEPLSEEDLAIFKKCTSDAIKIIGETIKVFDTGDTKLSKEVIQLRRELNSNLDLTVAKHFDGLSKVSNKVRYIDLVYVDILAAYERIYSHCSNIAKLFARDKNYELSDEELEKFNQMANRY